MACGHRRLDWRAQLHTAARRPERPLPTIESLSRKNCELFQNFGQSLINVAVGFCQRRQGCNCQGVQGPRDSWSDGMAGTGLGRSRIRSIGAMSWTTFEIAERDRHFGSLGQAFEKILGRVGPRYLCTWLDGKVTPIARERGGPLHTWWHLHHVQPCPFPAIYCV